MNRLTQHVLADARVENKAKDHSLSKLKPMKTDSSSNIRNHASIR